MNLIMFLSMAFAEPLVAYKAQIHLQLNGPTFAGRLDGEIILSEENFRVSIVGPSGSDMAVFIGVNSQISGALLAEGIIFPEVESGELIKAISQEQFTELDIQTVFLGQWSCERTGVECREKNNRPRLVNLGEDPVLSIQYPNYKVIKNVELPSRIRIEIPPIDWKLRFNMKHWSVIPYDASYFDVDYPEAEIYQDLVPMLKEMLNNVKVPK